MLISGQGLRSTDAGKTWQQIKPFPDVAAQGVGAKCSTAQEL
jgi:hypothetical protein